MVQRDQQKSTNAYILGRREYNYWFRLSRHAILSSVYVVTIFFFLEEEVSPVLLNIKQMLIVYIPGV